MSALKKKSILNYYKKRIKKNTVQVLEQRKEIIKSALILREENDLKAKAIVEKLAEDVVFNKLKIQSLIYCDYDKKRDYDEGEFTLKDFSLFGKVVGENLKHALDKKYDMLITINETNDVVLNVLTLESKALFKVGLQQQDEVLNDLVLSVNIGDTEVFNSELKKYLKVLNKL